MAAPLERRASWICPDAAIATAPAEALPVADGSVDVVVSTMVLCTVTDSAAAVDEIRRVLRPGGRLLFIEHVRAGSPAAARRQDRLNRPWRAFAAGCNCNRATLDTLLRRLRRRPGHSRPLARDAGHRPSARVRRRHSARRVTATA